MKRIMVSALKGGVGKTTTSCGIALALQRRGLKVGLTEIDITGSSIWKALGLSEPPPIETDTAAQKIIPSTVKGIEVFTIASYYAARGILILPGQDQVIEVDGQPKVLKGTSKYSQVMQMLESVRFSEDLDYMIYDLPPNYGDDMQSLWDNVHDVWGVVIVSQPTSLSEEGFGKTIDMLNYKKLPLLGLIVNMDGVECPECHAHFSPFTDTDTMENPGIPIIARIPFAKNLDGYFDEIAVKLEAAKPIKMGEISLLEKMRRKIDHFAGTKIAGQVAKNMKEHNE
jgi:ATP-binding protein involved in chromosome partitioning